MSSFVTLPASSNQALGLGQFALGFLAGSLGEGPSDEVFAKTSLFHADAVMCGISALALKTNAPTLLRQEAYDYPDEYGATVFGGGFKVKAEKAVAANSSAVREWDSNGTNFGYNPVLGHTAGEFGHNDYYPVVIAACQEKNLDGATALRGMVLLDEIRGRLAEVFSLKSYKIDHVVHGGIASAVVYSALRGATAEEIESAIGTYVAHYIPWRAIRAGEQLSDSKGASAAIAAEAAVLSARRALNGFVGPADIFRNPESMFRQFCPTKGDSPFEMVLSHSGDDFAVAGMHFKIGLYEHQSAGGLQGLFDLLAAHPELRESGAVLGSLVRAYEPAFGIIGDPAKRDPRTRQSADHSMVYILATALRKAIEQKGGASSDELWRRLMLMPEDYSDEAIANPLTRELMEKIQFEHGGPEYDEKYPDGIPTSVDVTSRWGSTYTSGLVMYPAGHARNTTSDLGMLLTEKLERLGQIGLGDPSLVADVIDNLNRLGEMSAEDIQCVYDFEIADRRGLQ